MQANIEQTDLPDPTKPPKPTGQQLGQQQGALGMGPTAGVANPAQSAPPPPTPPTTNTAQTTPPATEKMTPPPGPTPIGQTNQQQEQGALGMGPTAGVAGPNDAPQPYTPNLQAFKSQLGGANAIVGTDTTQWQGVDTAPTGGWGQIGAGGPPPPSGGPNIDPGSTGAGISGGTDPNANPASYGGVGADLSKNQANAMYANLSLHGTAQPEINDAARQANAAQLFHDYYAAHPGDTAGAMAAMQAAFQGGGYGNAQAAAGADTTPEALKTLASQVAGVVQPGSQNLSQEQRNQQMAGFAKQTFAGQKPWLQGGAGGTGGTSLLSSLLGQGGASLGGAGVSGNVGGGGATSGGGAAGLGSAGTHWDSTKQSWQPGASTVGPMQSYQNLATGTTMQGGQISGQPIGTLGVASAAPVNAGINPVYAGYDQADAGYFAAHPEAQTDQSGRLSPAAMALQKAGTASGGAQPLQQAGVNPIAAGALSTNPGSLSALLGGGGASGGGTSGNAGTMGQTGSTSGGGVMQGLPANTGPAFNLSRTTPDNALTNSTIEAGPGTDRYAIAQQQLANYQKATDPQYQASMRDALRQAAAGGAIGSGQLQTSIGDLANQRNLQMETQGNDFLSNALTGSLSDAWNKIGLAQQQQGFQAGQQQNAFGQGVTQTQLADQLKNSAFGRALQQQLAGSSGDPTSTLMGLSGIFGNQATGAGNSLAQLIAGLQQRNTQQGGSQGGGGTDFMSFLQQLLGSGGQ